MQYIVQFMVYSNLLVSLSAAFLTSGLLHYYASSNWLLYGFISFFGVFTVYNFQRIYKARREPSTFWLNWVSQHMSLLTLLTLISGICLIFFLLYTENQTLFSFFLLGFVAFVCLFYVIPLGTKSLREFPFTKSLLISIVWVIAIIIFPLKNNQLSLQKYAWENVAYFIYFFALTIPSDLRDIIIDSSDLKTLPQLIGPKQSKWVVALLLTTFALVININYTTWLFWLPVFIQLVLVVLIKNKRSDTYFALIDACISGVGVIYFFL